MSLLMREQSCRSSPDALVYQVRWGSSLSRCTNTTVNSTYCPGGPIGSEGLQLVYHGASWCGRPYLLCSTERFGGDRSRDETHIAHSN